MAIKWNLAYLMLDRNLKTGELAVLTGLHANTVSKLKAFREMPKRLDSKTLSKLCMALNCQPGELLTYLPDKVEKRTTLKEMLDSLTPEERVRIYCRSAELEAIEKAPG